MPSDREYERCDERVERAIDENKVKIAQMLEYAINIAKSFKFMIDESTQDPFANGVTHMGIDEGSVKGWEYYREVCVRLEQLEKAVEDWKYGKER